MYESEYFDKFQWNDYYFLNTAILKNFLKLPYGTHLLDVGCGKGLHVKGWKMNDISAIGIDLYYKGEGVKEGTVLNIPFPDKCFDVVTCMDVVEHINYADLDKAISELRRVCKKFLIIQTCFKDEEHHKELFDKDNTHIIWETKQWWLDKLNTVEYGYLMKPFEYRLGGVIFKFPHVDQVIITTAIKQKEGGQDVKQNIREVL